MAVAIRGTTPATTISTGNPISLTLTGTRQPQTGDQLVIICCNDFYALSNITTPTVGGSTTGVTAITGASADGGTNNAHAKAFIYSVASTGDLTVAQTETGTTDEDKGLVVYVLSGANGVDVAAGNSSSGAAVTNHDAPSVSPTSSDAYLICHDNSGGGSSSSAYTPPSGMTEVYDTQVGGISMTGAVLQLSSSGATGTKTFTVSGSLQYCTLSIAIKTAAGGSTVNGSASLTGAGTLTAVASVRIPGSAALTGAGTLGAAASVRVPGAASPTGAGILTAAATVTVPGAASMAGAGSLAAAATVTVLGAAVLTGAGTLAASSGSTVAGGASLAGAGSLTAAASVRIPGAAALAGAGTLAAAGTARVSGAAALAGTGVLTANSGSAVAGSAALADTGTLAASGLVLIPGGALLAGTAVLAAGSSTRISGTAALVAAGVLTANVVGDCWVDPTDTGYVDPTDTGFVDPPDLGYVEFCTCCT